MNNKKRIFNLVTSTVAGLVAVAAIIGFINEPMSLLKALGIYFATCCSFAIVEFLICGFSDYYEKVDAIQIFTIGFGLVFVATTVVILLYITPLWLAILGAFIALIIMLICHLIAFILGAIYSCRKLFRS